MDYLDVKKIRRNNILLMIGYVLVAIAITLFANVLLYQAHGFSIGKNGQVVQNGLIFFSSHPNPASIYTNGHLQPNATNTRLTLPAGIYTVKLTRNGYFDWQRRISVVGDDVQHFDYPFLIPRQLDVRNLRSFAEFPGLMTNSPDHRWLVLQPTSSLSSLLVYDLKNPDKEPLPLDLPVDLLSKTSGAEKWQVVDWADDNKHFMLEHDFDGKTEFILVDRTDATQSVNLNKTLAVEPTKLEFKNRKYDQYLAYETPALTLRSLRLQGSASEPVFQRVLAYKSYGENTLLYVTDSGAPAGKVWVKLSAGSKTYNIRLFDAGGSYVVDLTRYSGSMYVVAAAASDNRAYIYNDPVGQMENGQKLPAPTQVLHVEGVNYVSFSASAQFIVAENGARFGVYDIENKLGYNYTATEPLDSPQIHATWMDGNRLTYGSGGKLIEFDYDHTNQHILGKAAPDYKPAFSPDFKFAYLLTPAENGQFNLTETALLTRADR